MQHVQYQVNLISSIEYQVVITAIHHNLQGMQGMGRCCEGGDSNKAPSATLAPTSSVSPAAAGTWALCYCDNWALIGFVTRGHGPGTHRHTPAHTAHGTVPCIAIWGPVLEPVQSNGCQLHS